MSTVFIPHSSFKPVPRMSFTTKLVFGLGYSYRLEKEVTLEILTADFSGYELIEKALIHLHWIFHEVKAGSEVNLVLTNRADPTDSVSVPCTVNNLRKTLINYKIVKTDVCT